MQTNAFHLWGARAVSFLLAAVAAASGAFWVLKSTDSNSVSTAMPANGSSFAALDPQAVARALGGAGAAQTSGTPVASAHTAYALLGVLADGQHGGAALIAVDGKTAKPYRVGAVVDGNLVLQSVSARRAVLAMSVDGPAQVTLEMPPLSK